MMESEMITNMRAGRSATRSRTTSETSIRVSVSLDDSGRTTSKIDTGLGFLDHMLDAVGRHSAIGLIIHAEGDLRIDDHHTVEDCAIVLGQCLDEALGERRGIARFGHAYAPLDESLARAVIDLSGRPHAAVRLEMMRDRLGDVATENLTHFFVTLAGTLGASLHVDVLRGENDHHKAEAAFKAFALALRQAITLDPDRPDVPSTKGTMR